MAFRQLQPYIMAQRKSMLNSTVSKLTLMAKKDPLMLTTLMMIMLTMLPMRKRAMLIQRKYKMSMTKTMKKSTGGSCVSGWM